MRTLRILTIWFCVIFGLVWACLSIIKGSMYVPPGEIQGFLIALISGKWAQSYVEKKGVKIAT